MIKYKKKIKIRNRKLYTNEKYDTIIIKDYLELDFDINDEDINNIIYILKDQFIYYIILILKNFSFIWNNKKNSLFK